MLFVSPFLDGDEALVLAFVHNLLDFLLNISKMGLRWHVDVFLEFTCSIHKLESFTVDVNTSVFLLADNGSGSHIACSKCFFILLVSKDVFPGNHCLGRSVLSWLGG